MSRKYCRHTVHVCSLVCIHHLLGFLQDWMTFWVVLNAWSEVRYVLCPNHSKRLIQAAMKEKRVSHEEESVRSRPIKWRRCGGGADELSRSLKAGATDASGKPSHVYCWICRKDMSIMTFEVQEILRHYQGTKHFLRDQRLRIETLGWRMLDFEGNPMREDETERQRGRILRAPLVERDRGYAFSGDLIVDSSGSVDVSLPTLAKVSALIEALRLGGSYELVHQL